MSQKGRDQEIPFGNLLEDIPTLDDVRLEGGFFAGLDRGEWIRNLEHHFRYGEELLMLWGEPGVGKSTLLTQLASRLDPDVYTVITLDARRGGSAEHLWGALDKRLSLPAGAEGWEALKRLAKKRAGAGQSLAIIIDHADKLQKEAVQLMRAMIDVHLPEVRFVLAMDGKGESAHGLWPVLEAKLFECGQLARLWPFADEDAQAYLDFRIQHADLGDVTLTEKQKQTIIHRTQGNAGQIRIELQRLLSEGALVGKPGKDKRKAAPARKSVKPAPAAAESVAKKPAKPKQSVGLPKAHSVALSVLAVVMLGSYLAWETPVPKSTIATPSPTEQRLPPVIKHEEPMSPVTEAMEINPPASGGLPSPVKTMASENTPADVPAEMPDDRSSAAAGARALADKPHMQPPVGFVPSNVPLMATQAAREKPVREAAKVEAAKVEGASQPAKSATTDVELVASKFPSKSAVSKAAATIPKASTALVVPLAEDAMTETVPAAIADEPPPAIGKTPAATKARPSREEKVVSKIKSQEKPAAAALKTERANGNQKAAMVAKAEPTARSVQVATATPTGPAKASGGAYTLQIMGLKDLRSVQAFMQRNAEVKGLRYHTGSMNGEPWYLIVQGEYPSRQAAQAAVKSLPAALQASRPFPKSVSALQGSTQ